MLRCSSFLHALAIHPDDVCVSWLPLYHDMGLIGACLGALYHGVPTVILSPLGFLARPSRWLRALHAHRGTLSPAPNFAVDLCGKRVADDEIEGLDLRAWRLALNGSEPVSPETIDRFVDRFAPYGFRHEAMCPVYGLAEASVGLTLMPPGRGPRVDRVARDVFTKSRKAVVASAADRIPLRFVSCGKPLPGHEVLIVDDAPRPVPDRSEGDVLFRGPSVAVRGGVRRRCHGAGIERGAPPSDASIQIRFKSFGSCASMSAASPSESCACSAAKTAMVIHRPASLESSPASRLTRSKNSSACIFTGRQSTSWPSSQTSFSSVGSCATA